MNNMNNNRRLSAPNPMSVSSQLFRAVSVQWALKETNVGYRPAKLSRPYHIQTRQKLLPVQESTLGKVVRGVNLRGQAPEAAVAYW